MDAPGSARFRPPAARLPAAPLPVPLLQLGFALGLVVLGVLAHALSTQPAPEPIELPGSYAQPGAELFTARSARDRSPG